MHCGSILQLQVLPGSSELNNSEDERPMLRALLIFRINDFKLILGKALALLRVEEG